MGCCGHGGRGPGVPGAGRADLRSDLLDTWAPCSVSRDRGGRRSEWGSRGLAGRRCQPSSRSSGAAGLRGSCPGAAAGASPGSHPRPCVQGRCARAALAGCQGLCTRRLRVGDQPADRGRSRPAFLRRESGALGSLRKWKSQRSQVPGTSRWERPALPQRGRARLRGAGRLSHRGERVARVLGSRSLSPPERREGSDWIGCASLQEQPLGVRHWSPWRLSQGLHARGRCVLRLRPRRVCLRVLVTVGGSVGKL